MPHTGKENPLLFALGQIDKLREDVWFANEESNEKIEEFYELICAQPANDDLPPSPELCTGDTIELKSDVLGIDLSAYVDANQISILIEKRISAIHLPIMFMELHSQQLQLIVY